jgi:hypothetical protein
MEKRTDILSIIKYKVFKRNSSALTLLWDLDVCFNDVTLLKIKYIYLKEKYGEGDILYEAKTGTNPVLFTCSLAMLVITLMNTVCLLVTLLFFYIYCNLNDSRINIFLYSY